MKVRRNNEFIGHILGRWRSVLTLVAAALVLQLGELAFAAAAVSSQMVEELKRMPRAEQEALARQYGVELSALGSTREDSDSIESGIGTVGSRLEPVEVVVEEEPPRRPESEALPRYGAHLFDRDVSTFAPVDSFPVPNGYLMGPGDTLNVILFGKEPSQEVLQIDREGVINFPRLGSISLAGLAFREAKRMIEQRVERQMIGTEALVSMGRLRSINVFLAGEVRTPGSYAVSALSTVTQVVYVAGGINNVGSLRNIQVRRGGSIVTTFDVYDLMLKGEADGDIRIQAGDVLFVPTVGPLVKVDGAVRRPGEYELRGEQTLGEVLDMAGGIHGRGYTRIVRVERYSSGNLLPEFIAVDISDTKQRNMRLQDGDSIMIERIIDRSSNPIEFIGALARPGKYAWFEGARFSDYVTSIDADLLSTTDLGVGLIARRRNRELQIDVLSFDVADAVRNKGGFSDPVLNVYDQVFLFDLASVDGVARVETLRPVIARLKAQAGLAEEVELVGIGGAVREAGEYPLLQGGSVDDLISLAGGLEDGAYVRRIEIRRINSVAGVSATVELLNMSLSELTDIESGFSLRSRDFVHIHRVQDWRPSDTVAVAGEVAFPGEYLISPGETLNSVLTRAGGITVDAFPEGAVLTRVSVREAERVRIGELSNAILRNKASRLLTSEGGDGFTPSLAPESATVEANLVESLLSIEMEGRLVIDLPRILAGEIEADLHLQDGDLIMVPLATTTITVVGEVNRPGSFRYDPKLSRSDYIQLAAGRTTRADERSMYVIKANGLVNVRDNRSNVRWLKKAGPAQISLEVGDTIVVPINQDYQRPLSRYRELSTVVFQGIVSLATLLAL